MKTLRPNQRLVYPALVIFLSIALAACEIPLPFQTPPPPPEVSDSILTQAAATILAEVGATQTQSALLKPTGTPQIVIPPPPLPSPTQEPPAAPRPEESPTAYPPPEESPTAYPPPEESPTVAAPPLMPTATTVVIFPPTGEPFPTVVSGYGGPIPTVAITPFSPVYVPTTERVLQMGTHFYVDNVNLAMCYGYYWAVFTISNNGTNNLESAQITVQDLSTGRFLYGPTTDNTPFMWTDNTCEAGYRDTLISGGVLFVGGRLNDPAIKLHTLGATVKLCSQDKLKGACFTKKLEFVVP